MGPAGIHRLVVEVPFDRDEPWVTMIASDGSAEGSGGA